MLISPSEPAELRAIGRTTMAPERYGADILWAQPGIGLVGVQRKEFPGDFLASVGSRLPTQLAKMARLDLAVLVLEGRGTWSTDGELAHGWGQSYTRSQHRRYLCSVRARGIWVEQTESLADTIEFLGDLAAWAAKPKHHSLAQRDGPKRNGWGRVSSKAWQIHLVQGIGDGIGPEMAERIVDAVGLPFSLCVDEADLVAIHGVGKVTAKKIVKAFEEEKEKADV